MTEQPADGPQPGVALLELYDAALPHVYGYLLSRCRSRVLAEDLTAEIFLAAVVAVATVTGAREQAAPPLSIAWLVGVARHKLVDHWRREEREQRGLCLVHDEHADRADPWDATLDALRAREVPERLAPHHRAALTLRYLDGLPVPEVATTWAGHCFAADLRGPHRARATSTVGRRHDR